MVYKKVRSWTSGRRVPRIKLRWLPPGRRECPFNVGSAWYRYQCKMEKATVTISFQKCPQIQGSTWERPRVVSCKSAADEISFEWLHHEIFTANSLRAAVQTVCRYVCHNKTLSPFSYTWAGHLAYSLANTNACERRTNTTFQVGEGGLKETENEVKNNFEPLWKLASPVFFSLVLRNFDDQGSRQEWLILSGGSLHGWLRPYTLTRKKLFYAHWK